MIDVIGTLLDRQEKYVRAWEEEMTEYYMEKELDEFSIDEANAFQAGLREEQEEVAVW